MNNTELFSEVDIILQQNLSSNSIKDMCTSFQEEINIHKGKYSNNFILALEMGEKGEAIVQRFLENLGYIFISKCENITHDYVFIKNGKEYIFEIKTDVAHMCQSDRSGEIFDTNNMAIEYESRGHKSGISVTKADFFITYYPYLNEIWLIKTEKLKNIIRENKDTIKRFDNVGDSNSNTKLFMLKKDKFREHFRIAKVYES